MRYSNISQAKSSLSMLIGCVEKGEEVVIGRAGKPVARIVRYQAAHGPRVGGQWRGKVRIADDFDELPEHILLEFGA